MAMIKHEKCYKELNLCKAFVTIPLSHEIMFKENKKLEKWSKADSSSIYNWKVIPGSRLRKIYQQG